MEKTFENISETVKENWKNLSEVIRERLFSPMYSYFIIAWLITNRKFIYVLFSTDENIILSTKKILKVEFLSQFYNFNTFEFWILSLSKLIIIPAISAFIAVWWLTILSENFYKKYKQHKQNKRIIDRELIYEEKVKIAKSEKEIRDIEFDKKSIKYEDNDYFNDFIDEFSERVIVGGIEMRPSEVLYNNDYEAYKEQFEEWKAENTKSVTQ